MKSKGKSEAEVMAGILSYLAIRGDCFFWRQGNFSGVLPGGFMHAEKGVPDIIVVKGGIFIGIEAKREFGGALSDDQERFGRNVMEAGGRYFVVRSVDEVEALLGPVGPRIQKHRKERVIHR